MGMQRSGIPATTPARFSLAPVMASLRSPFGMWKMILFGYCSLNQATQLHWRLYSLCFISF